MIKITGTQLFAVPVCVLALVGCGARMQDPVITGNAVEATDTQIQKTIGEDLNRYSVYGSEAFHQAMKSGSLVAAQTEAGIAALSAVAETEAADQAASALAPANLAATPPVASSIVVAFPMDLLGHRYVFGSVITGVSEKKSDTLGRLKLIDLTPLHVTPRVFRVSATDYAFALTGCVQKCEESSDEVVLLTIPILGINAQTQQIALDLSALGKNLNLMEMVDPGGAYTQMVTESARTVRADYSLSTLVFDVETTMVPKKDPAAAKTVFTARWYLRLTSSFDPSFVARTATPGVGFFMTERAAVSKIQRLSRPRAITGLGNLASAHYYIKNVPKEYRAAFNAAFDSWNKTAVATLGKPLLSYEHVETTDPRYANLVAGDARFHILEWDLDNLAPYGGLGPSLANQHTGEIFSANVLIQGPKIIELYSAWFKASQKSQSLRAVGDIAAADAVLLEAKKQGEKALADLQRSHLKMTLGKNLEFRVPAQDPALEDPAAKMEFEIVPAGYSFEKYMAGYFQEMVAHELGHNIGLRHNFRGNLYSTSETAEGKVSHSIMEYLGRGHRHLNRIGDYDVMAIRYGYQGTAPTKLDGFCTDEDVPSEANPALSAECSRDDATSDPFSFFLSRLERATSYLTAPGSVDAPAWTVKDMDTELTALITNLGIYARNPAAMATKWTNFSQATGRPQNVADVKSYTRLQLQKYLCSDDVLAALDEKGSMAAKRKTLDNIQALWAKTSGVMAKLGAFTPGELDCE